MEETEVMDIVDRLLDAVKYEIDEMRRMGEDTQPLENQLRQFKKKQDQLVDWFMKGDQYSIKLFISELTGFSRSVHDLYNSAKSGKQMVEMIKQKGEEKLKVEREEAASRIEQTYDILANPDLLLKEELGEIQEEQKEKAIESRGEEANKSRVSSEAGVMETRMSPEIENQAEDVEKILEKERKEIDLLKKKGVDTLDLEFVLSQQDSLLVSMKEALLEGNYAEAQRLKKEIERLRDRFEES